MKPLEEMTSDELSQYVTDTANFLEQVANAAELTKEETPEPPPETKD